MTQSAIGVSTGTDKYLNSNSRSIGGTAREEQVVLEGQSALPTYNIQVDDASVATANAHILQVMADGSNYSRLVRWSMEFTDDIPAAADILKVGLYRLSTAGTGGTTVNDAPYDTADSYSGDMRTLPSSKGTEGQLLQTVYLPILSTADPVARRYVWEPPPYGKPIVFGTGTSDGLAWKVIDNISSAAVTISAEIVTTPYL